MKRPGDTTLMAFADGVLEKPLADQVEQYLQTDDEARRMVEMLRDTRELAKQAFDAPMRQPPPQALIDTIMNTPIAKRETVVPFAQERRGRGFTDEPYALPLAASIALLAGIGFGLLIKAQDNSKSAGELIAVGPLPLESVIGKTLETRVSGSTVGYATPASKANTGLSVLTTFRDREGRICREFEITAAAKADAPIAAGVACRGPERRWTVEGAAYLASGGGKPGEAFIPSGTETADPMDSVLKRLGATQTLTADEETRLIAGGWK